MTARPGYIPDPNRLLSLGPRTLEHLRHAAAGRTCPETAALMWVLGRIGQERAQAHL